MRGIPYLSIAVILILSVGSCKKPQKNLFYSYNQQAMLTNIGNNILVPAITGFSTKAAATQIAIDSFIANPDTATLSAAQNAFSQLAISWAAVEPFNFGPMLDNQSAANINTWPIDTSKVQTAINAQASASTQGADAKGLKALEYLLFDRNGNQAVLAKYTSATDATNRKNYLLSVAETISGVATNLQTAWTGTYLNTFITAQGNNVGSSVSLMVNSMAFFMDQVKNMKVGSPIGMGAKVNDNLPHPDLIEYPIAELSIPAMNANLQSMQTVLDGGTNGPGLKDLLNNINAQQNGQSLATVGDNEFTDAITKVNAITPPFAAATSNQTQKLKDAYTSLKQLIVFYEVDVASDCGISITFNDTDGD